MIYGLRPMRRPLMRDPRLLIDWIGGTPLAGGVFSRASDGMTRGAGGAWHEVAPDVPRTTWRRDASGVLVPATLLEPGATNLVPGNRQRFEGWSEHMGAVATITQGQTIPGYSPAGAATRIQTTGGAHVRKYWLPLGQRGGESETQSVVVSNIGEHAVEVFSTGGGPAPVVLQPGETMHVVTSVTETTPDSDRNLQFRALDPAHDLDFLAYAPQVELTAYATSPILDPTVSSPVSRAADSLYVPLPPEIATPGTPLAIYVRALMGADPTLFAASPGLWGITTAAGSTPALYAYLSRNTGRASIAHVTPAGSESIPTTSTPTAGDILETLTLIGTDEHGDLVARLIASVNRGPLSGADLPPLAPAAAWSAPRLYIGSRGSAPGVYEYEALKVYAGRVHGTPEQLMAWARGEI